MLYFRRSYESFFATKRGKVRRRVRKTTNTILRVRVRKR
jgi:hypothetical protein